MSGFDFVEIVNGYILFEIENIRDKFFGFRFVFAFKTVNRNIAFGADIVNFYNVFGVVRDIAAVTRYGKNVFGDISRVVDNAFENGVGFIRNARNFNAVCNAVFVVYGNYFNSYRVNVAVCKRSL